MKAVCYLRVARSSRGYVFNATTKPSASPLNSGSFVSRSSVKTRSDLFVPITYCAICDAGRVALDVPDKPCRHRGTEHRRTFMLATVPADPHARLPRRESR
jgi:hypothetical protein